MNSKVYNILKWIALVFLDALGVAYQSLSEVWNLPFGDEILKTCAIISVFLGTILGISNMKYNKKIVDVLEDNTIEEAN